jgi:predicted PurR-regulated permease PerM
MGNYTALIILALLLAFVLTPTIIFLVNMKKSKLKGFWILPMVFCAIGVVFLSVYCGMAAGHVNKTNKYNNRKTETYASINHSKLSNFINDISLYREAMEGFALVDTSKLHYDYTSPGPSGFGRYEGLLNYFQENYDEYVVWRQLGNSTLWYLEIRVKIGSETFEGLTIEGLNTDYSAEFTTNKHLWDLMTDSIKNHTNYLQITRNTFSHASYRFFQHLSVIILSLAIIILNAITLSYRRKHAKKIATTTFDLSTTEAQTILSRTATEIIEQTNAQKVFCSYCGAKHKGSEQKCNNCGATLA